MLSSCRASCGKCGPSSGSQKGAQKPTEVLRDDAYSLHAGSVSGAGRHLHSGMYTLVDARAYCDGKEQCGGFSVDLLRVFEKGGAVQRAIFDAIMADLRAACIPASWRIVVYALLAKPWRR